jgi:outer membrane protein assembly factor BamE (lipoprotein component of BamABCDE complex)
MRWSPALVPLVALAVLAGCVSIKFGREFPSPDRQLIVVGKTDKATLERLLGAPYQVGIDSGDQTWRWFYGQRDAGTEISKDLSVRFNADGTVKSYAFTSNFVDDMARLK